MSRDMAYLLDILLMRESEDIPGMLENIQEHFTKYMVIYKEPGS